MWKVVPDARPEVGASAVIPAPVVQMVMDGSMSTQQIAADRGGTEFRSSLSHSSPQLVQRRQASDIHFAHPKEGKRRAIHQYPPNRSKSSETKRPRSWSFVVGSSGFEPVTSWMAALWLASWTTGIGLRPSKLGYRPDQEQALPVYPIMEQNRSVVRL